MRILVTGSTGVVGSHLLDFLATLPGLDLYGTRRWRSTGYQAPGVTYVETDITDYQSVKGILDKIRPQVLFHLAAQSYTAPSFAAPRATWDVNAIGTLNVLEALSDIPWKPEACVIAGSAAAYGEQALFPTAEDAPLRPVSPYGCTKAAQDLLGFQYYRSHSLPIIRTRSYIHVGTRQGLYNAVQAFCQQIATAETISNPRFTLKVGNLDTKRDILDVRDAVRGFWAVVQHGVPGEAYNICRGEAYGMREIVSALLKLTSLKVDVAVDAGRLRLTDPPIEVGNNAKLTAMSGWRAEIPFTDTLKWILDWRRSDASMGRASVK